MSFTFSTIHDCRVTRFQRHTDARGSLTALSQHVGLPLEIKRVFYLYDIPHGATRGGHAHYDCHQVLIAVSGRFEVVLDDGNGEKHILLDHPCDALHILPGIWASQINFSPTAVCLALASHEYNPNDYIHDYDIFKKMKSKPMLVQAV